MKKVILTLLLICFILSTFANDIQKQELSLKANNSVKFIQLSSQSLIYLNKMNNAKENKAQPECLIKHFKCGKMINGVMYVTEGWGLTGAGAMRRCKKRLERLTE